MLINDNILSIPRYSIMIADHPSSTKSEVCLFYEEHLSII